ncbi:MAG: PA14 domain-containing protein, partial [Candidatus Desantisbacteria bacterium]
KITYAKGTLTEGLLAEYFDSNDLSGSAAITRIDPTIDFDWYYEGNTPGGGISGEFSARWQGMIRANVAGTYYFANYHVNGDGGCTDDGMRLFIDDTTVFDEYWNNDTDQTSSSINLSAGWHKIRVEYRYRDDSARAYLWWYRPDWTVWRSIAPDCLSPVIEAKDASNVEIIDLVPEEINYATATLSPSITQQGTYTKLTWNMGSLPKYTRDSIIIIGSVSESAVASTTLTNYASITTPSLEATKDNNISSSTIHIKTLIDLGIEKKLYKQGGLYGEYFSNSNLQGTPTLTRIDSTIDFNWGGSPPISGKFSVRWQGLIKANVAGTYYFANYHADGDGGCTEDGMKLFIDDKTIFDEYWNGDTDQAYYSINLSAGWHKIRVEYRYRDDGARAYLWWQAPSSSWGQIPSNLLYNPSNSADISAGEGVVFQIDYGITEKGFLGEYFDNQSLIGTPVFSRIDPTIDFNWYDDGNTPGGGISGDFSARWQGMIRINTAGTYYFANYHADGDLGCTEDGMRLFIDDYTIFDEYWNGDTDQAYYSINL